MERDRTSERECSNLVRFETEDLGGVSRSVGSRRSAAAHKYRAILETFAANSKILELFQDPQVSDDLELFIKRELF
jgi:hypothetical protein